MRMERASNSFPTMPKLTYTSGSPDNTTPRHGEHTLPNSVQEYLDHGAPEGGRNRTLFAAACQMRDIGATESATVETLLRRALADGLKEGEAVHAIKSAFAAARREPPTGSTGHEWTPPPRKGMPSAGMVRPSQNTAKPGAISEARPIPLPETLADGFKTLLLTAFKEGEGVCIAPTHENEDGSRTPSRGATLSREAWLEKLEKKGSLQRIYSTKEGLFIRVNPMKKGGKGTNEDVTAFRHVLVEFDTDAKGSEISKELQLGAIIHSGLPITAILDSGNKSVHAWVRLDAASLEEYDARVDAVYSLFDSAALDKGNRNPSRFSRCPEGRRTERGEVREQRLLAVNLGAKSWADFERLRTTAELGEPVTLEHLLNYDVPNDPNNMIGARWLCLGGSLVVVSQCLSGETPIHDPYDGSTLSVKERAERGSAFHVLARKPDGTPVIAPAHPPKRFTLQPMMRVVFSNGESMKVTPHHRFLTTQGYVYACDADRQMRGGERVLLPSISGADLAAWRKGALHSSQRVQDSTDNCSCRCRQCDEPLQSDRDSAQGLPPSRGDAHGHTHSHRREDDLCEGLSCSLCHPASAPLSMKDSLSQSEHGGEFFRHIAGQPSSHPATRISLSLRQESEIASPHTVAQPSECVPPAMPDACRGLHRSAADGHSFAETSEAVRSLHQVQMLPRPERGIVHTPLGHADSFPGSIETMVDGTSLTIGSGLIASVVEVVSIEAAEPEVYYDFFVPEWNNYWACGVWSHNSGIGKSSLNMQLGIGWALGREDMTFGIKPVRPLKSLILQAENDEGDLAEAAQGVVNSFGLSPEERKLANGNLLWHRITTYTGAEFCRKLEDLVTLHKPDIAWIDPLINFIGDDLSEASVIANFCTGWLNAISRKTGVIFALIHHTGKPPKDGAARGTNSDLAYAGLGSSALVNWAREVMVLSRVKTPEGDPATFTLTACKRRKRAGMRDTSGEVSEEIYIRHASDGTIRWEQCEKPEPPEKPKKGRKGDTPAAGGYSLRRRGEGTEAIPGVLESAEGGGEGGDSRAPDASAPEASTGRSYTLRRGGPTPKLDSNARAVIAAALAANGGILTPAEREQFAATFGVSSKTIRRFEDATNGVD